VGLFLALSGVVGAGDVRVVDVVRQLARARKGDFDKREGTTDQPNIGVVQQAERNTTVLYPNGFCEWDDFSQLISQALRGPVFSFHIHDDDLWMYRLFHNGDEVGRFNPLPDYWGELSESECDAWKGDPDLVSRLVPGVERSAIERYFVRWRLDDPGPRKAYPEDEFAQSDWQMVDFMRKIGLTYPMDDHGNPLGATYRLWTADFPLENSQSSGRAQVRKKPWWRFW
jgi:hypothetical protein